MNKTSICLDCSKEFEINYDLFDEGNFFIFF